MNAPRSYCAVGPACGDENLLLTCTPMHKVSQDGSCLCIELCAYLACLDYVFNQHGLCNNKGKATAGETFKIVPGRSLLAVQQTTLLW